MPPLGVRDDYRSLFAYLDGFSAAEALPAPAQPRPPCDDDEEEIDDPALTRAAFRPTQHMPMSEAKLALMAERARLRLPVCHPDDTTDADPIEVTRGGISLIEMMLQIRYVVYDPRKRLWRVRPWQMGEDGKRERVGLGSYPTKEEGVARLVKWRRKYFGSAFLDDGPREERKARRRKKRARRFACLFCAGAGCECCGQTVRKRTAISPATPRLAAPVE